MKKMNAHQRLWRRLATVLSADQYDWLLEAHRQDLARDRQHSQYRTWQRREREVLRQCAADPIDYPDTVKRAKKRLPEIQAWLSHHKEWNPDVTPLQEREATGLIINSASERGGR